MPPSPAMPGTPKLPLLPTVTAEHQSARYGVDDPDFYPMVEALARARGLDPDRPKHLSKVTRIPMKSVPGKAEAAVNRAAQSGSRRPRYLSGGRAGCRVDR